MIYIADNLKFLRENKELSIAETAASIGVPKSTYSSYEYGKSEPKAEYLVKIADFYSVDIFELITKRISKTHLNTASKSAKNSKKTHLNTHGNTPLKAHKAYDTKVSNTVVSEPESSYKLPQIPHILTVNEHGIDNIIYVPIKAQAGYLNGYGDPEFMETLPSFRMPGLSNATYRMFEVGGISMVPTLSDNDRVIGEYVSSFNEIRENRVHVIVHTNGVAVKRVLNRVNDRQKLYLKSDTITNRSNYPITEIDPEDIREIWYVRLRLTGDLREPSELYTRVSDLEINVHEMMKKIGK